MKGKKKKEKNNTYDDITYSEDNHDTTSLDERYNKELKKIKDNLRKCLEERQEYLNGWQRSRAEFQNMRREYEGERQRINDNIKCAVLSDILEIVDTFDIAFQHESKTKTPDEVWRNGIKNIYSQLLRVLGQYDVKAFGEVGEEFSPNSYECVGIIEVSEKKDDGKVLEVLQKGYRFKDVVMRPSRVKIGEFKKNN